MKKFIEYYDDSHDADYKYDAWYEKALAKGTLIEDKDIEAIRERIEENAEEAIKDYIKKKYNNVDSIIKEIKRLDFDLSDQDLNKIKDKKDVDNLIKELINDCGEWKLFKCSSKDCPGDYDAEFANVFDVYDRANEDMIKIYAALEMLVYYRNNPS